VDGVIEARTATLLAPYLLEGKPATGPDALGKPTYSADRLARIVEQADAAGFQVHMHAIGDGAVRMGLDAIAHAARKNGPRDRRAVLAHLELIDPSDVPRFRALGAVACIQPYWAYPDEYVTTLTAPVIGPDRTARLYPAASLARAGATLAGGSDWSVTTANPLKAVEVAVTRQAPDTAAPGILGSGERLTLAQALEAYTLGGAHASFEEKDSGSLVSGKWADFVVLDRDPFKASPREIGELRVRWTVREGRTTFRATR
jgi:predicted amidohydrolase YtcJ